MVRSSNLTRHGDDIIERVTDATGQTKFIAKRQFQQFIDEVGDIVNATNIDGNNVVQEIQVNSSKISEIFAKNSALNKLLNNAIQEINDNDSQVHLLIVQNTKLKALVNSNNQLILLQNSTIDTLKVQSSKMEKRINNLEQLINDN